MRLKLYISLFICVAASYVANAQAFIASPNDSAFLNTTVPDQFTPAEVHIHLINNTGQGQQISWALVNYTTPAPAWEVALCDNVNCYDMKINPGPHLSNTVAAGDSMDTKFQFTAHCVNGTGDCNIAFWIDGDSANTVTILNYKAQILNECVNAVTEIKKNSLHLYPNPVQHSFMVTGLENAGNLAFEVYDLQGRLAESQVTSATTSTVEISIANLPAGSYVLKAIDKNGLVVATSQLSKSE